VEQAPHGDPGSSLNTVFVSSTRRDIDRLRKTVRLVLTEHFKDVVEAFPTERWDSSLKPAEIVAECRKRVMEADAFVLILGLWYGWIPRGYKHSITHLEFKWARQRWLRVRYPRVFVLVPYVGGTTWRVLRKNAETYLRDMDSEARAKHKVQIDAFHEEAIGGKRIGDPRRDWRIVNYYDNDIDLFRKFKETMAVWKREAIIEELKNYSNP